MKETTQKQTNNNKQTTAAIKEMNILSISSLLLLSSSLTLPSFHIIISSMQRYRAICCGKIEKQNGTVDTPISGKESHTRYEVVSHTKRRNGLFVTTVDLWPITGRQHQLRRHLKEIGHPIVGDIRYADVKKGGDDELYKKEDGTNGLMYLWALEIEFPHPFQDDKLVKAIIEEPKEYEELRSKLAAN
jgi:23S rRNA-/tRNA-specific pseudouridylate synthase